MTPKEKAIELVDKIYYCQGYETGKIYVTLEAYKRAKQCALIAVDEIINNVELYSTYWQEVKQEIEKL